MNKFKKLLLIPRALVDVGRIYFNGKIDFKTRYIFSKTLLLLKFFIYTKPINSIIGFTLLGKQVKAYNNTSLQFLIKEIFLTNIYKTHCVEANRILDGGSNIGLSILYFRTCFKNAEICSFEPDTHSFNLLKNNVDDGKVRLHKLALSTSNNDLYTEVEGSFASINSQFTSKKTAFHVKSQRFIDLLDKPFDIIKLDIEGAEWDILDNVIDNSKLTQTAHWLIEFHDIENRKLQFEETKKQFQQNGFQREERGDVFYFWKLSE
jgi:FkbM family methyltransferase